MPIPINPAAYYQQPQMPQQNQQWVSPYQQTPPSQQRQYIQMIPVSGIEEVNAYPVVEPTYFFDKNLPVFYTKDLMGVRIFDYSERIQNEQTAEEKPVTRAEFEELKKLIDDLTK